MSERKVISKYYPPEFDPSMLPRRVGEKSSQTKIRMMLPMSIRCLVCGEYMGQGKKFNSRKETVEGEDYLGLKVFRFYVRCTRCSSELIFKTDPKGSRYVADKNCVRNFEPWRDSEEVIQAENEEEWLDETGGEDKDEMKLAEARTKEMKAEMDALDDLDELKSISAQNQAVDLDQLLLKRRSYFNERQSIANAKDEEFTQEEQELINEFKKQKEDQQRIEPDQEEPQQPLETIDPVVNETTATTASISNDSDSKKRKREDDGLSDLVVVKKVKIEGKKQKKKKSKKNKSSLSLLSGYN